MSLNVSRRKSDERLPTGIREKKKHGFRLNYVLDERLTAQFGIGFPSVLHKVEVSCITKIW